MRLHSLFAGMILLPLIGCCRRSIHNQPGPFDWTQTSLEKELASFRDQYNDVTRAEYTAAQKIPIRSENELGISNKDFRAIFAKSKAALISKLAAKDECVALRDYFLVFMPDPDSLLPKKSANLKPVGLEQAVPGDALVSETSFWRVADNLATWVTARLFYDSRRPFKIDIFVQSFPTRAHFVMHPVAGGFPYSTMTNDYLRGVYRGYYALSITKVGWKEMDDKKNLVDSDPSLITCKMVQEKSREAPGTCVINAGFQMRGP